MRKLSIFIAASLDGYIATNNEDLSFLKIVEKDGEDYGYGEFIAGVDTIIIGRKTYDWVKREIGLSHYEKGANDVYVITRTIRPGAGKIRFYTGDPAALVRKLKSEQGKNIYCDGGAELINEFLLHDLVDEMTISVIPVLLGSGIRLFKDGRPEQKIELVATRSFPSGLVQLHYKRRW